jgi:hypothetical protein
VNRDDIIRVMCDVLGPESEFWSVNEAMLEEWLPFLQAIAAAEREACAKVAENGNFLHDDSPEAKFGKACAAAIRARGQA